jgi:hypothetical protein
MMEINVDGSGEMTSSKKRGQSQKLTNMNLSKSALSVRA